MINYIKYFITSTFHVIIWTDTTEHGWKAQICPGFVTGVPEKRAMNNCVIEKSKFSNPWKHRRKKNCKMTFAACLNAVKINWKIFSKMPFSPTSHLSSIRHLFSRTLQWVLKSSNSLMHLRSCWHTDNAWLHVGKASTGYGSFSAICDGK